MLLEDERRALAEKALAMRRMALKMIATLGTGHVGGSMSIIEMLTVLYHRVLRLNPADPAWEGRDRLVLSKGHGGPALYSALIQMGYLPPEALSTLNQAGTRLPSHCDMRLTRGIDMTTGSLGQGFSIAVGMALALALKGSESRVFAIIGDGECQEGIIWEAAMLAGNRRLHRLIALLDYNKLQSDGPVAQINGLEPIEEKWRAFGWRVLRLDGHDLDALDDALHPAAQPTDQPTLLICDTIKGKGAYGMEGLVACHNTPLSHAQWQAMDQYLTKGGDAS